MCLAAAYEGMESEQPILQDIAHVKLNGDVVELETLLGEKKILQGKVREIDFVNSKIVIQQNSHTLERQQTEVGYGTQGSKNRG